MTNAEAWFNIALRPRKLEGSLGRTAQDVHLDSHTAPELWPRRDQEEGGAAKALTAGWIVLLQSRSTTSASRTLSL